MTSKPEVSIPIIDLQPLLAWQSQEQIRETASQIRSACIEVGFLYLTNHGIDDALIQQVFTAMRNFFALDAETKSSVAAHTSPIFRGYNSLETGAHSCTPENQKGLEGDEEGRMIKIRDLKESFTLGADRQANDPRQASPLHGMNQWPSPQILPGWREVIEAYQAAIMTCMQAFMKGLALSLHLKDENFFIKHTDDATWQMVLLRYLPEIKSSVGNMGQGCGQHTDCGFLTTVLQNDVKGLEVLTNQGTWVVAKPIPGTLVINLGDLLSRWSNDLFHSSIHRVRSPSGTADRYSCVFFLNANFDSLVECVVKEEDKDKEGEAKDKAHYPPIKAGHYLLDRLGLMWKEGGQDKDIQA